LKNSSLFKSHICIPQLPAVFIAILIIMASTSCTNLKKLQYLQEPIDTARLNKMTFIEPVIQKGDLLNIIVYSDNPTATALYNQPIATVSAAGGQGGVGSQGAGQLSSAGYLVDKAGNIQFQGLGTIHVDGFTKKQLSDTLDVRLKPFLQNPYYNIRFLNYKVTVIGDVNKPSVYSIPSEQVNILEVLALAGDLTITANRKNVLVIREQNGKRDFGRIDLTNPDLFNSPFYQLKQNDIVYVDLTKQKAAALNEASLRYITFATSILSAVALIITIIRN